MRCKGLKVKGLAYTKETPIHRKNFLTTNLRVYILARACTHTHTHTHTHTASLVAQAVKNLPAMQETWVPSLGQEDPLEKGMATHSSFLAWRIPWTEEPGGLHSPCGRKELDMSEQLIHTHTFKFL